MNKIIPKNSRCASLITFPDFDDTAKNLTSDAAKKGFQVIILMSGPVTENRPVWAKNITCVKKYSLEGMWYFLRSKYVFFTHNHYPGVRVISNQTIVNLWHGMPIKDIGKMDSNSIVPVATYTIASCEYFCNYFSKAFNMPREAVIDVAHPRLKSFLEPVADIRNALVKTDEQFGIWLPTYRHSQLSGGRTDGDAALDIVGIEDIDYPELDATLVKKKIVIYIKPHPMNLKQVSEKAKECTNIRFIDDKYLMNLNTTLYEAMALSDFLITDISSVYFDYKILHKKIIIAFCDKDKYIQARCVGGRSYDDIIREPVICTQKELINALTETVKPTDDFEYMKNWQLDNVNKNIFEELSKIA